MEKLLSILPTTRAEQGNRGGLPRPLKVVLIRPPVLMPKFNMATMVTPPLGLAYVGAALRRAGHQVSVVDSVGLAIEQFTRVERGALHGLRPTEIVGRVAPGAECIGVSIQFSYEWPVCKDVIRSLRERFPDVFLFAGGEHMTAVPELCMEGRALDAVGLGQGAPPPP